MSRRAALVIGAVLVIGTAFSVCVASRIDPNTIAGREIRSVRDLPVVRKGPQPSLALGQGSLNGRVTDAQLKGKVVVYDFWTYSCVNCVRTMPYLRAWHERYAKDGLVLVGVHSPEFEFEKTDDNVRDAVRRLEVTWPVVFDDDMDLWNAFENQYWPAKYVADRNGDVRYIRFGEGAYEQTETVLRLLLGVDPDSPRAAAPGEAEPDTVAPRTPETYLGTVRGGDDHVELRGRWTKTEEYVESRDAHEALAITYQGGEVNLVMARNRNNPTLAVVELDGKPIPERYRGADIVERVGFVPETETIVRIDAARMYRLVRNGPKGKHELTIRPAGAGVQAFAFTFGA